MKIGATTVGAEQQYQKANSTNSNISYSILFARFRHDCPC